MEFISKEKLLKLIDEEIEEAKADGAPMQYIMGQRVIKQIVEFQKGEPSFTEREFD